MTLQFDEIKSAQQFCDLMRQIWADRSEPAPNGGMRVFVSKLYDRWQDARDVARHLNGKRVNTSGKCGIIGDTWLFPSGVRVFIARDGSMTAPSQQRRRAAVP